MFTQVAVYIGVILLLVLLHDTMLAQCVLCPVSVYLSVCVSVTSPSKWINVG